jgi:hypothetical protein
VLASLGRIRRKFTQLQDSFRERAVPSSSSLSVTRSAARTFSPLKVRPAGGCPMAVHFLTL